MTKATASNANQMTFADLGVIEAAPASTPTKANKKAVTKRAPVNQDAVAKSLKALLVHAENLGHALQDKYDANLEAHRIQSRVGISVDVEDIEQLLLSISEANKALNSSN